MNKIQTKKIFKAALLIYLASFLIINWSDVSWIFNYRAVSGLVSDFFNPYPSIDASTINAYFSPGQNKVSMQAQPAIVASVNYTSKQNTLEIPKIGISVPIVFATSADKNSLTKDLDLGVVYYPGSVMPGQIGQAIILGHSAPPGWPTIKHDWVFTDLDKLSPGDQIFIDLNNSQYTYIVKQKTIIQRGAEIPSDNRVLTNNVLTLISCWPPGKDYQRITVQAELASSVR
ncbi:MAG: class E sortase [Candidatus Staskawiczbacteria bacterium]|nr:class E sortase [Candidatus Staskawiczbacteria bacterium]